MLPALTVIADLSACSAAGSSAYFIYACLPRILDHRLESAGLERRRPGSGETVCFAFVISLMGCYYGLRTSGGTQGVGRATTQAVVTSSVLIFMLTFFITKFFVWQSPQ